MPRMLDLLGQRFGRLVVQAKFGSVERGAGRTAIAWLCQCDCGQTATVTSSALRSRKTRSCGCLIREFAAALGARHTHATRLSDITGHVFGLLTAIRPTSRRSGSSVRWICRCACGNEVSRSVSALTSGDTKSCGCRKIIAATTHGATKRKQWTPEYKVWAGIMQRCLNSNQPAYARYGGRGITVCENWRDFKAFLADMGPRPDGASIDRIDNGVGYQPDNCRWATSHQQNRNRRDNHRITINGQTKCIAEWAEETEIPARRIASRLRRGWPPERAVLVQINHKAPRAKAPA